MTGLSNINLRGRRDHDKDRKDGKRSNLLGGAAAESHQDIRKGRTDPGTAHVADLTKTDDVCSEISSDEINVCRTPELQEKVQNSKKPVKIPESVYPVKNYDCVRSQAEPDEDFASCEKCCWVLKERTRSSLKRTQLHWEYPSKDGQGNVVGQQQHSDVFLLIQYFFISNLNDVSQDFQDQSINVIVQHHLTVVVFQREDAVLWDSHQIAQILNLQLSGFVSDVLNYLHNRISQEDYFIGIDDRNQDVNFVIDVMFVVLSRNRWTDPMFINCKPRGEGHQQFTILFYGKVGAGETGFINSVISLEDKISHITEHVTVKTASSDRNGWTSQRLKKTRTETTNSETTGLKRFLRGRVGDQLSCLLLAGVIDGSVRLQDVAPTECVHCVLLVRLQLGGGGAMCNQPRSFCGSFCRSRTVFSCLTSSVCSRTLFFFFCLGSTFGSCLLSILIESEFETLSGPEDPLPGQDRQRMTPPASRNPAAMKVTQSAPPGWYLLLSGRSVVRKAVMTSLVKSAAGTRQSRLARTKQPPAAIAVWPFARWLPPHRVHLSPSEARQSPNAATMQHRTMPARIICSDGGSDSTESFMVQLKTPELYHTQSAHRPCI
ncbi:hypothetical protein CCH79_00018485 [Gambusia affinis]|uniref:Uncharacterized protein n=1 Tax=Gambusia affinis TaxID=33528 RepID=A0A315URB1_GAMAF|nr:hypothetical protein CCH79_00018485 [Gambusia affinis]